MADNAQCPAIIVSSGSARTCAPTGLARARRGELLCRHLRRKAEISRVSVNDSETRELRKQVDSLVELLGHHGVRLEPRSSMTNGPPRQSLQQGPSMSNYVTTDPPLPSSFEQTFQNPQISMPLPQSSYSGEATQPGIQNPTQLSQQPFIDNVWSHSPIEGPPDGVVRQSVVSPSNEASHGTLVISASGHSKYLGPSAASEWLKDVSPTFSVWISCADLSARGDRGVPSAVTPYCKSLGPGVSDPRSGT